MSSQSHITVAEQRAAAVTMLSHYRSMVMYNNALLNREPPVSVDWSQNLTRQIAQYESSIEHLKLMIERLSHQEQSKMSSRCCWPW